MIITFEQEIKCDWKMDVHKINQIKGVQTYETMLL